VNQKTAWKLGHAIPRAQMDDRPGAAVCQELLEGRRGRFIGGEAQVPAMGWKEQARCEEQESRRFWWPRRETDRPGQS